ncbi:pimeloyl-ACP methyl ester carboxylesterase [Allocatelliglobosispora scoriae]|uniref:Pimeloyl-ACP methyl ester carboxylesterase n=1 Tax=Allocatelliglobosispora scoriae TaxID=643052 RepID=A0A841BKC6_9ACTN|nr:alpha/beta fold hydrolase [Allocatelliglobosispora scoriae]MBB5868095.1 pimeloyl-ACP methyl ester carboxylesterase [Allocatelliglobosispora scoriae]
MTALAYRAGGNPGPDGTSVVLLHGLGGDASSWREVAPLLGDLGRTYAVDLRGHGDSPRPGDYSAELMRDDVVALLDELALERVVLVGHSLGGLVAYLVALASPERTLALVLEEPPPPVPLNRPDAVRPDEPTPFDWAVVPAIRAQVNHPDPRWWGQLATITVPTLLVAGGPESHVPQHLLAEMAAQFPNGKLSTIPGGHSLHEVYPQEFADSVRRLVGPI